MDQAYLRFGVAFEREFVGQGAHESRSMSETLDRGWSALSLLPRSELTRVRDDEIDRFYAPAQSSAQRGTDSGRSR